jgi:hypothetical protein
MPQDTTPERYFTIKAAAEALGLKYWLLLRATKQGLIPTYNLLNCKRLVRLSEVVTAITVARLSSNNPGPPKHSQIVSAMGPRTLREHVSEASPSLARTATGGPINSSAMSEGK